MLVSVKGGQVEVTRVLITKHAVKRRGIGLNRYIEVGSRTICLNSIKDLDFSLCVYRPSKRYLNKEMIKSTVL